MADDKRLSVGEFLTDIRRTITSPRRRFPVIHERDALWGSLVLLLLPAYFGFGFVGGIYFRKDPFPGYSFLMPAVVATIVTFLKLFSIHFLARVLEGKGRYAAGRGTFQELLVVFGYTGIPSIIAMLLGLVFFLTIPEQVGLFFRNFRVLAISAMVAIGLALFIWNLILMVLALRSVYAMRDWKIVVALLVGPLAFGAVTASVGSLAFSSVKIDAAYVRPYLSERIAQAIAAEPIGDEAGHVKISIHLDRLAYRVGAPEHFDPVAVVPLPYTEEEARRNNGIVLMGGSLGQPVDLRTGRVVGVPGNRIQVSDGSLRINGQPWAEPYIAPEFAASFSLPETVLGDADYLVLPEDRRLVASMKGELVVKRHQIYGRLIVNKWPLGWWWFRATVFGRPHPAAD